MKVRSVQDQVYQGLAMVSLTIPGVPKIMASMKSNFYARTDRNTMPFR